MLNLIENGKHKQVLLTHHLHDGVWIEKQLAKIPEDFHAIVRAQYGERYLSNTDTQHEGERRRNTNVWFRET
ncbi:hypothetical protein [Thiothrix subterranea]|uniref:Uncharacterized protein n=1 Tax=Thiothrix subterranea TaxID=2735563 RepID=A0AA51MMI4_9GAMM|nr:hypothetical protein [Thiothrix subterranea]MDQ5770997.1 hypothetical protein [Thiothrix subterranea]WML85781.1 hypothetical protein RCG00_15930 [Thiothrix subterranea]